jgi:hypothetical protein
VLGDGGDPRNGGPGGNAVPGHPPHLDERACEDPPGQSRVTQVGVQAGQQPRGQGAVQSAERGPVTSGDCVDESVDAAMSDMVAGRAALRPDRDGRQLAGGGAILDSHGSS